MAIALEFINVIVPIARIRECYPGGWERCVLDYAPQLGRRVWFDEHLFRDGAMTSAEVRQMVEGWQVLGFKPTGRNRAGKLYWKDLCVVDARLGGPTLPCDWLNYDAATMSARQAGAEASALAWRRRPRTKGMQALGDFIGLRRPATLELRQG